MSNNVKEFFDNAKDNIAKHSPEIFTGLAIVGVVSSVIMSIKATPIAMSLITNEKDRRYEEALRKNSKASYDQVTKFTLKDYVKTCWKPYLAPALLTSSTIGCMVASNYISAKRNGTLVAAYGIAQQTLMDYQKKVVEEIGPKKNQEIKDSMAKEKVKGQFKGPFDPDNISGEIIFYDSLSKTWFKSTKVIVDSAFNQVNADINKYNYAKVRDLYEYIGAKELNGVCDAIADLGWQTGEQIDMDDVYTSDISKPDDKYPNIPYIIINLDRVLSFRHKQVDKFGED